ncbi:GIN domain-containing protein [Spongiimicrobium salis]|uniref:GIN domain-containing protein n=1 Tax=Spongiimicrobium salis TaxID=1667022 RepID=UPI00374DB08E
MKNSIVLLLVLFSIQIQAQRKPKIKGSKNVIEVREDLPPFNAIELNDDLEIRLVKGATNGYDINADDNLIDVLKFKVSGETLVISSFYKITGKKKLDITVRYDQLQSISIKKGKIVAEQPIDADELFINAYENAKLELNANAALIDVNMEGNSSGNFNLDVDSLSMHLSDKINTRIYAVTERTNLDIKRSATLNLEGTTDVLTVDATGSANMKAEKYEAAMATLKINGTAKSRIYAYKEIELAAKGSARIQLYGTPKITITEFLDTAVLSKKKL